MKKTQLVKAVNTGDIAFIVKYNLDKKRWDVLSKKIFCIEQTAGKETLYYYADGSSVNRYVFSTLRQANGAANRMNFILSRPATPSFVVAGRSVYYITPNRQPLRGFITNVDYTKLVSEFDIAIIPLHGVDKTYAKTFHHVSVNDIGKKFYVYLPSEFGVE